MKDIKGWYPLIILVSIVGILLIIFQPNYRGEDNIKSSRKTSQIDSIQYYYIKAYYYDHKGDDDSFDRCINNANRLINNKNKNYDDTTRIY